MPNKEIKCSLEGDVNVELAELAGVDTRRSLGPIYFQRKPILFIFKFFFAYSLILLGFLAIARGQYLYISVLAILINGLMFTHLIELQHECMHGHAFRSPSLNRLFGFACGLFMMSSNSHYRYDHLRHHAWLGTSKNLEHFNYRFSNLDSMSGFMKAFFDLRRYKRVYQILSSILRLENISGVEEEKANRDIKQEYGAYAIIVIAMISYSVVNFNFAYVFVLAWVIPSLFVAGGVHFMIEMPEHFGLNTMSEPNVLANTRTIKTNGLIHWFVNGNDLHTAHHYHHGIPMCNIKLLHRQIEGRIKVVEESYFSLYKKILRGVVRQQMDASCMNR